MVLIRTSWSEQYTFKVLTGDIGFNTFLKLIQWDKQIPAFTKLILNDQAKLMFPGHACPFVLCDEIMLFATTSLKLYD